MPAWGLPATAPQVSVSLKDTGIHALSAQQPKAMLEHPSGLHSQPASLTQHPQTLGGPGLLRLPKKLYHRASPGPGNTPLFVFEEGMPGDHWPFIAWFGGESGGATTEQKRVDPRATGLTGETALFLV